MSTVHVTFSGSKWAAYVTGAGTSRMLRELRDGKPAEWDRRLRAYVVTERIAGDLLALAEAHGHRVYVTGQPEQPVDQGRLW